ncbi:MAG: hypothetical protein CM1200mP27_13420 [Chloroflexota bacterium]|nr:MAG: hypothetical protein CM1200mP27_13420 [Chloroflexota bacterium]
MGFHSDSLDDRNLDGWISRNVAVPTLRTFLGGFVLGGIGLLSNLTFLPPNSAFHLGFYLFTALLLVARVQAVRRKHEWENRSVKVDDHLAGLYLSDSFGLRF